MAAPAAAPAAAPPLPPPGLPPPGLLPPPLGMPPHRQLAGIQVPLRQAQTSLPPSNVVLLTGIPKALHQGLSSWILPCGPARTILWYPKQFEKDEAIHMDASKKSIALVTMMHGDGAWKLVHTVSALQEQWGSAGCDLKAHLVPASPDIPLPPIILDDSVAKPLQQIMKKSFEAIQKGTFDSTALPTPLQQQQQPLETHKLAAAAGGHNYDEDADPLNAPAVLQAVREFRASLHKTSAVQQTRRIALVQERLDKAMEALKNPPPPPPPSMHAVVSGVPPLGGLGLPPPPPPPGSGIGLDTGKRGQSNLPAWITSATDFPPPPSQPSAMPSAADDEQPPVKKVKLTHGTIDESLLRAHVAQQITHYMGVEEATLIDFCVQHVMSLTAAAALHDETPSQNEATASKVPITWEGLEQELQPVLEEDTPAFVEELQRKVKELCGE